MRQILAFMRKEFLLWAQKPGSWIVVFVAPILLIWIMQAVFGGSGTPVVTVYAVNEDESPQSETVMAELAGAEHLNIEVLDTREEADRRVGSGERMAAVVIPEGFGSALSTSHGAKIELIIDPARAEQANIVIGLVNAALGPFVVEAEVTRGVERGVAGVLKQFGGTGELDLPAEGEKKSRGGAAGDPFSTGIEDAAGVGNPTGTEEPSQGPGGQGYPGSGQGATPEGQPTAQPGGSTGALPGAAQATPFPTVQDGEVDLDTLKIFFTAALKGVVSHQVQETMENPPVQVEALPFEGQSDLRRPALLDFLVPGYSLLFVYFLIPSLALTVIEERQTGTLRRLLVSPVPRSRILLGKLAPYFIIAVAQLVVVLLVSRAIFGIDLGNSWVALAIIILSSAFAMTALGILIAAFAQTEGQADGLAVVVVLAMAVVSGAVFPSISIPGLQNITPHYWSMQGFLNVISRGQGIDGVMLPAGVLLTMAAVFFTIGAIRFRFE